jgi:hypothetical protein
MRTNGRAFLGAFGSALVAAMGLAMADDAHEHDDQHKHGAPLHGGTVSMTKEYHFEVVFTKDGLKVYPRSHEDKPVAAPGIAGAATFYHPNSPKPWFERKLTATAASSGEVPPSIGASIDLSKVPATGVKVEIKVTGLPEPAETTATFSVPFAVSSKNEIVVAKATKADEKAISELKTCPVSKEDLESMGGALKVTRGDKSTFICCKGCLKAIQADPEKFFGAKAPAAKGERDAHDYKH